MTELTPRPDDEIVCYHEAGHAVASVVLGRKVLFVEIDSGEDDNGIPHHGRTSSPPMKLKKGAYPVRDIVNEAWIALAGSLAQARGMGTREMDDPGDTAKATELTRMVVSHPQARERLGVGTSDLYEVVDAFKIKTRELLDEHWPAVERVVDALRTERTISGVRLRQLVKDGRDGSRSE